MCCFYIVADSVLACMSIKTPSTILLSDSTVSKYNVFGGLFPYYSVHFNRKVQTGVKTTRLLQLMLACLSVMLACNFGVAGHPREVWIFPNKMPCAKSFWNLQGSASREQKWHKATFQDKGALALVMCTLIILFLHSAVYITKLFCGQILFLHFIDHTAD